MHKAKVVLQDACAPNLAIDCQDPTHGESGDKCPLRELWIYDGWDAFHVRDIDADGAVAEGEFAVHYHYDGEDGWIVYGAD